jgi:hypothetical protein
MGIVLKKADLGTGSELCEEAKHGWLSLRRGQFIYCCRRVWSPLVIYSVKIQTGFFPFKSQPLTVRFDILRNQQYIKTDRLVSLYILFHLR